MLNITSNIKKNKQKKTVYDILQEHVHEYTFMYQCPYIHGRGKISAIFDRNRPLSGKRYGRPTHGYYGSLIGSDRSVSIQMTLSELERRNARVKFSDGSRLLYSYGLTYTVI